MEGTIKEKQRSFCFRLNRCKNVGAIEEMRIPFPESELAEITDTNPYPRRL